MSAIAPGPLNLITDVPGLKVGQATDETARSGVSVLLCPDGWTAAVDIRGGAPGGRESDALALENLVGQVHAVVLSGGSVFGLGAADGVTAALSAQDQGMRFSPLSPAIPIVAGAVLHDLGNGGDKGWGLDPPYRKLGLEAVAAAGAEFELGSVGAGRGARAGVRKGGIGSASVVLEEGLTVGALVAANPIGSVYAPDGETFWAWPFEMNAEFGGRGAVNPVGSVHDPFPEHSRLGQIGRLKPGVNTTIAVVACSADLTRQECRRVATMAHNGMARAVRPAHTPFDGDTVYAVAKGDGRLAAHDRQVDVARIGSAAADCLARAIARAVWSAAHQPA